MFANTLLAALVISPLISRRSLIAKGIAVLEQQYKIQTAEVHTAQAEMEALRQKLKLAGEANARPTPQEEPYLDQQRDLSQLLDGHKRLDDAVFALIVALRLEARRVLRVLPGEIADLFGPDATGMIVYGRQGQMSVQIMRAQRPAFRADDARRGSAEEIKAGIGGFSMIQAPSREDALKWEAKIAVACRCALEVRELMDDPEA